MKHNRCNPRRIENSGKKVVYLDISIHFCTSAMHGSFKEISTLMYMHKLING